MEQEQPLHKAMVSYIGLTIAEKENLSKKVHEMGGQVSIDFTENVTYLIARDPGANEYNAAYRWRIKILKPGWIDHIHDQWTKGQDVDMTKSTQSFSEGLLTGCEICVTGFLAEMRMKIEQNTILLGGMYTHDMVKNTTTHLICGHPSGEKYKMAIKWGTIKCLPLQWFQDILENFAHVAQCKKMIRIAGGLHVAEYDPMEVTHVLVPSDKLDPSTIELFNHDTPLPYIVTQHWLWLSNKEGKVMPETDFIVPFPKKMVNAQQKSVRFEGETACSKDPAFIAQEIDKDISSSKPKDSNTATVRPRLSGSATEHPSVFTGIRSKEEKGNQASISTDQGTVSPPSHVSAQGNRRGLSAKTVSGNLTRALDDLTMNTTTPENMPTQDGSRITGTDTIRLGEEEETHSNIFLGLYISSYGCKESAAETIREQTVACGGTYFEDLEVSPSGANNVRIIVPLSTPLSILIKCFPSFYFTSIGFEELCISVSSNNMKEAEYKHIGRAIKILGGTFLDSLHTTNTNLLISDQSYGPKYDFMTNNGHPVVRMDWLKQCIEEGKRLPFQGFILNEDTSKVNEGIASNNSSWEQSSNSHPGDESSLLNNSMSISQVGHTQQLVPSDTPLEGLAICIPSRVIGDHREMQDMVIQMGARVIMSYDSSATHFVHKSKATADAKRNIRAAKRDGLYVVSPAWLYKCLETGLRVNERDFPETHDDKHTTLTTRFGHTPRDRPAPELQLKTDPSSPGRAGVSPSRSPTARLSRSAILGRQKHRFSDGGQPSPTQTFQGTAAGATSALFAGDSLSTSVNMSSANTTMEMSSAGASEMYSQQAEGSHSDRDSIWQPVLDISVGRSAGRKRRRAQTAPESASSTTPEKDATATCATLHDTNDGSSIPEDYFDKSAERYGEDEIYWVDVEGREKKRALLESLGYKTVKSVSQDGQDRRLLTLAQDMESQRANKFQFLLTGLTVPERKTIKKAIIDLGGVVLEDINDDHDDWQKKCTHLITSGNNPPRTAKLVIAKSCKAIVVNKHFMLASAAKGVFVDETPFRVNM
ncbi:DNA topoisomerase 2-binding protein 1 [Modicella reniformis]|uniref:DNA topoisomerase 2-binding protein 1 n=1 Tax=Modicella reniformis TaxID=1440133 RepID=A0A9P6MIJ3_9FUNG|nr:DNA topoisomerase 2-binding protein 1 [Modicella reniformis]